VGGLAELSVPRDQVEVVWDRFQASIKTCMEQEDFDFDEDALDNDSFAALTFVDPLRDPRLDEEAFLEAPYDEFNFDTGGSSFSYQYDYESDSTAYNEALFGDSEDASYTYAYQTNRANLTAVPSGENGGCFGLAKQAELPALRELSRLQGEADATLGTGLRRDVDYRKGEAKWSACMEDAGFRGFNTYKELGREVFGISTGGWFGSGSKSTRFESEEEVADVAKADLVCFAKHVREPLARVRARLEPDFLVDNEAAIASYLEYWSTQE